MAARIQLPPQWVSRADAARLLDTSGPNLTQWVDSSSWFPGSAVRETKGKRPTKEYDWKAIWNARVEKASRVNPVDETKAEIARQNLKQKEFETAALQRKHDAAEDNILPRDEWTLFASELCVRVRDAVLILPARIAPLVPEKYRDKLIGEAGKLCEETCRALASGIRKGPND